MPSYPLQNFAVAVVTVTPAVAACVVALRIYARRSARTPLTLDDYLVVLASFLSLLLIWPSIQEIYMWHMGVHIWEINQEDLEPDPIAWYKTHLAFNLIYTPILPLVKASIILFLIKVGWVIVPIKRALYVILAFNTLACVGPWVCLIFLCPPVTGNTAEPLPTTPTVFNGLKCFSARQGAIIYIFLVSVNLATDILICPIPTLLIFRLKSVSLRARISIIVCFALSLSATALGAIRFKINYESNLLQVSSSDWTYNINFVYNHAENNVAIILACLPPLRAFLVSLTSKGDEESEAAILRRAQNTDQTAHWRSYLAELGPLPNRTDNSSMDKSGQTMSSGLQESLDSRSGSISVTTIHTPSHLEATKHYMF